MIKRKIISFIIIGFIILMSSTVIFAIDTSDYEPISPEDYDEFTDIGSNFISIIQFVGIIIAVIMLTLMGMKYMLGSVEEKAEYKKNMIPYLVGCVFIMCSSVFVGIIEDVASRGYSSRDKDGDGYVDYDYEEWEEVKIATLAEIDEMNEEELSDYIDELIVMKRNVIANNYLYENEKIDMALVDEVLEYAFDKLSPEPLSLWGQYKKSNGGIKDEEAYNKIMSEDIDKYKTTDDMQGLRDFLTIIDCAKDYFTAKGDEDKVEKLKELGEAFEYRRVLIQAGMFYEE